MYLQRDLAVALFFYTHYKIAPFPLLVAHKYIKDYFVHIFIADRINPLLLRLTL